MFDGPLQLFDRDEYFAKTGVDFRFATVKTAGGHYGLLMVENMSEKGLEEASALVEGGRPGALRCTGTFDGLIDVSWFGRDIVAKKMSICWALAVDYVART